MTSLFSTGQIEALPIPGADISFLEQLDLGAPADIIFAELMETIPWRQKDVLIHGKAIPQPRLTSWHGDPGMAYTYSGLANEPEPWTPLLLQIKSAVEAIAKAHFNSVLLNNYRGERDSIGFHSDSEPELGPRPVIASLSLGHERVFVLKPRREQNIAPRRISLPSGSLLIMAGDTQKNWVHGIEKERTACGARINLTFRTIIQAAHRRTAR